MANRREIAYAGCNNGVASAPNLGVGIQQGGLIVLDWKILVPGLLTFATLCVGIWQYVDKAAQANREPFLRQQLALAVETSELVGILASTSDPAEWKKAQDRFWVLYWGPLAIVENVEVEQRMVAFGRKLPPSGGQPPGLPVTGLTQEALKLDYALRTMILTAWKIDLSHLQMRLVER